MTMLPMTAILLVLAALAAGVILGAWLTRFCGERESELLHERVRRERAQKERPVK